MYERCIAVWIDHDHAQIVEPHDGRQPVVTNIESLVEARHRTTGQRGVPLPGHLGCNTESHDRNRRGEELNRFYDRVIAAIPAGTDLVVMGPGLAKREFLKRLRRDPSLEARVLRIQTNPKLSANQIVAELRNLTRTLLAPK